MKRVFLIRHAKSDWTYEGLEDIDRPLNQRGYADAYKMASLLRKKNCIPDLLITSPAIRATSTAFIFARNLGIGESHVKINQNLYEAEVNTIKKLIQTTDNRHNSIMLFGHNPTFTDFFNSISNSHSDNIPTCGMMVIDFNSASWTNTFSKKGKFISSDFPKDFRT